MSSSSESRWETGTEAGEAVYNEAFQIHSDVHIKKKVWEIKQRNDNEVKLLLKGHKFHQQHWVQ